jgi:hypothetical protein
MMSQYMLLLYATEVGAGGVDDTVVRRRAR